MEVSEVRKRVNETIERARRAAARRRALADEAAAEYERFLERVAVPLFRQIGNVLRAERHMFSVSTPAGSVKLTSDRSNEDSIELLLDTSSFPPQMMIRSKRARGRRILETEAPLGPGRAIREVTEEELLDAVLKELEPFVER